MTDLKYYKLPAIMVWTMILLITLLVIGNDKKNSEGVNNKLLNIYDGDGFYGPEVSLGDIPANGTWILKSSGIKKTIFIHKDGLAKIDDQSLEWAVDLYGKQLWLKSQSNDMILHTKYHINKECLLVDKHFKHRVSLGTLCKEG